MSPPPWNESVWIFLAHAHVKCGALRGGRTLAQHFRIAGLVGLVKEPRRFFMLPHHNFGGNSTTSDLHLNLPVSGHLLSLSSHHHQHPVIPFISFRCRLCFQIIYCLCNDLTDQAPWLSLSETSGLICQPLRKCCPYGVAHPPCSISLASLCLLFDSFSLSDIVNQFRWPWRAMRTRANMSMIAVLPRTRQPRMLPSLRTPNNQVSPASRKVRIL